MGLMAKLSRKVGPMALKLGGMMPGPIGIGAKVLGKVAKFGKVGGVLGAAGAVGGAVGGRVGRGGMDRLIDPRTGKPFKKRRRVGLSGRDILGAQKVARLVQAFGYRPKIKPRKRRR